jgi:hypothetical protein
MAFPDEVEGAACEEMSGISSDEAHCRTGIMHSGLPYHKHISCAPSLVVWAVLTLFSRCRGSGRGYYMHIRNFKLSRFFV